MNYKFIPSPLFHSGNSIKKDMYTVLLALVPAIFSMLYFFGFNALIRLVFAVSACIFLEFFVRKIFFKDKKALNIALDGSAILTGVLIAMNIPSGLDFSILFIGCFVGIVIAKQVFGGLGCNIFNPALVARSFMVISFPLAMTSWPKVCQSFFEVDVLTTPTPLGVLKMEGLSVLDKFSYFDLFIGNIPGSMGEISALALILGGIFLILKKVITWHIPVSYILTTFVFSGLFYLIDSHYISPVFHVLSGGLLLGAFFMATDYVTSPVTGSGKLIFGVGCALITVLIRLFGAYPEGVSFSILLMNALVPLINKYTLPKPFGASNAS